MSWLEIYFVSLVKTKSKMLIHKRKIEIPLFKTYLIHVSDQFVSEYTSTNGTPSSVLILIDHVLHV